MNPLLEQFLSEARDFLQSIGEKLMDLERAPDDSELMTELFRYVHTLKGNSGLFEFPEMTRVLHAGEDLMDAVRNQRIAYSQELADRLLDAMDFVGMLCDEIEANGCISARFAADSARLAEALRQLLVGIDAADASEDSSADSQGASTSAPTAPLQWAAAIVLPMAAITESVRMAAYRAAHTGQPLQVVVYAPAEDCFFNGDDPFFQAQQTPGVIWGNIVAREAWPPLAELDAYRCVLDFQLLTTAPRAELDEFYRYMPEQIRIEPVSALSLVQPQGDPAGGPLDEDFVAEAQALLADSDIDGLARTAATMLELSSPDLWLSSALRWLLLLIECEPEQRAALEILVASLRQPAPIDWRAIEDAGHPGGGETAETAETATAGAKASAVLSAGEQFALAEIVATQREILSLPIEASWHLGRLESVSAAFEGCLRASAQTEAITGLQAATATALDEANATALLAWCDTHFGAAPPTAAGIPSAIRPVATTVATEEAASTSAIAETKFGRRAEDAASGSKSLKVDQVKIDRLMNLIGEIVVAKNALPYLAGRAESVFKVRELSREIKAQYAVINRIAEEMQDAIMQVRMLPVSFVFQRFPRLVRDISRKLGKEVNLVLEGEETEADKNIIESLGDPLIHIVRNSLDHGFELPEVRKAAGKPAAGTLTIRAMQESDRAVIEIIDDGKGIDPAVIKRKAYDKGLIDEATLERISDQEAVNLVFAAGFSTVEVISDLSGRGVGMDVVRTAIEKANGSIALESEKGKGTRLRLSLPLSMAVTNVMIVESDGQIFGMPMDCVVETVRVPRADIRTFKTAMTTVLRGRIVPLKSLNGLLGISTPPLANEEDELAVLVVRLGDESVGLMVDEFRETVDIILKPMLGVLAGLTAYSGSALMGDGSVLMVLNVKELV
jgi:two-component system, chemotaxis family, sensor kinase CheA